MSRRLSLCLLSLLIFGCADRIPPGSRAIKNVQYDPGRRADLLNLYVPPAHAPLPLIVWVHGGAWKTGNGTRDRSPAMWLLYHGYAVANVDYRLTQEAKFPAQIEDCRAAICWLRAHAQEYQIDPNRIGVFGDSAGGHLVALLGTEGKNTDWDDAVAPGFSSEVQAVCDWYGPTDFTQMISDPNAARHPALDAPGAPLNDLLGGTVRQQLALAKAASPALFAAPGDPPFLIFHGDADPVVPFHQSEILAAALQNAGDDVAMIRVPGAGHGGWAFSSADNRAKILAFFDRTLRK
jgi:acetyl esterase/lipase